MYSLHPTMMEMLAKQRAGELRRQAAQPRRCQSHGKHSRWETQSQWKTVASGAERVEPGKPVKPGQTDVGPQGGWLGPRRDRVALGRPPSQAGSGRQCCRGPQRNAA